jgi:hypothetical protein
MVPAWLNTIIFLHKWYTCAKQDTPGLVLKSILRFINLLLTHSPDSTDISGSANIF